MQIARISTWKQVVLFGLAGPPIGALTLLLWGHFAWEAPLPFDPHAWLIVAFLAAYLYAGVPALVAGYSAALTRSTAPGPAVGALALRLIIPALVGAVSSVLFSLITIASELSASFASAGAFAALVCTVLVEMWARLRPNKSFKPTPLRGSA